MEMPVKPPSVQPPPSGFRERSFFARNPSVLIFIGLLAVFTLAVTLMSEALGTGFLSTSFIKTLGKTLC